MMFAPRIKHRVWSAIHSPCRHQSLSTTTSSSAFKDGESIVLHKATDPSRGSIFVQRLDASKTIQGQHGKVLHADIIGKLPRDVVNSSKKTMYRLTRPSLDEYVRLTPRLVTPIYPGDANLIVSLLDLHPDPNGAERIEILEAGTGHGGLTLHMARAVHAANAGLSAADLESDYTSAGDKRRAVIHSIEIVAKHSERAQAVVRGFRGGLYARNVDFHVETIEQFLAARYNKQSTVEEGSQGPTAFLTHAMLDLPGTDLYLSSITEALKPDGTLVVFNPSITQIAECVRKIQEQKIPLQLEQVLELGSGMSAGREWDVRLAQIRAVSKAKSQSSSDLSPVVSNQESLEGQPDTDTVATSESDSDAAAVSSDAEVETDMSSVSPQSTSLPAATDPKEWAMVCRPRVGKAIVGGGFVGVWRKKRMSSE